MNKLKMLALLPSLCLASCSQSSYYGVYEFRLGKTDGAHFGLSIELKDEANEKHEGYQNLKLTADLGSEISLDQMIDDYSEENIILKELLSQLLKIIPEDHSIDGYYNVTE